MQEFVIDIRFEAPGKNAWLHKCRAEVRSNSATKDDVRIGTKRILIEARRANMPTDIFDAANSTLAKQITKAICVFYLENHSPHQIKSITLSVKKSSKTYTLRHITKKSGLQQPTRRGADLSFLALISIPTTLELLDETASGRSKLHCVSHLIASASKSSDYEVFEETWKAFNSIYTLYAKSVKDFDCHRQLCVDIRANSANFPLACASVSSLTTDDILKTAYFFNEMLLKNHPTEKRTEALFTSILRNTDHRALKAYESKLHVRKTMLGALNLLPTLQAFMSQEMTKNAKNDADVVCLLAVKYAYFYRNKLTHAEQAHHSLRFYDPNPRVARITPHVRAFAIDVLNAS